LGGGWVSRGGFKRRRGKGYLFNHKALAKVLAGIKAAGLTLPERYPADWVVDCKFVGSGAVALILHPNCKRLIALLHLLLKFVPFLASALVKERAPIPCPCCGAVMKIVRTRIPPTRAGGPAIPPVARGAF